MTASLENVKQLAQPGADAAVESGIARLNRRSLHDELVDRVRSLIVEGQLAPGMRIHEGQLGTALGVSRTPLREALKVLASEGLVELVQGRGAVVKKLTSIDVRDMAGKPPRPPKPSSSSSPGTTVAPGTMGGTAPSANPARSSLDS